jgi:hypothetical protein
MTTSDTKTPCIDDMSMEQLTELRESIDQRIKVLGDMCEMCRIVERVGLDHPTIRFFTACQKAHRLTNLPQLIDQGRERWSLDSRESIFPGRNGIRRVCAYLYHTLLSLLRTDSDSVTYLIMTLRAAFASLPRVQPQKGHVNVLLFPT